MNTLINFSMNTSKGAILDSISYSHALCCEFKINLGLQFQNWKLNILTYVFFAEGILESLYPFPIKLGNSRALISRIERSIWNRFEFFGIEKFFGYGKPVENYIHHRSFHYSFDIFLRTYVVFRTIDNILFGNFLEK